MEHQPPADSGEARLPVSSPRRENARTTGRTPILENARQFVRTAVAPRIRRFCRRAASSMVGVGPFTLAIYHMLRGDFARERRAAIHGVLRYTSDLRRPEVGSALLRRNIHRMEKGLLMRPRRELFALDYVGETVECFECVLRPFVGESRTPPEELLWARDVLARYFAETVSHPSSAAARKRFGELERLPIPWPAAQNPRVPRPVEAAAASPVSLGDLARLAERRKSVRWFDNRPVPREIIDNAIDVARHSPSACNRQPFQFLVFDQPEVVRRIASVPMGTWGYVHTIPVFVLIVGRLRHFEEVRDRHIIYVDGALAAMAFVWALEAQGIATCCINWPDIRRREKRIRAELSLAPDEQVVMGIALGYADPDGLVAYSAKKSVEEIRVYNRSAGA